VTATAEETAVTSDLPDLTSVPIGQVPPMDPETLARILGDQERPAVSAFNSSI
jgi:hypothetical protein